MCKPAVREVPLVATGPSHIVTFEDVIDAVTVGLNGANAYLNDLWRDRTFSLAEDEPQPARPDA